MVSFIIPALLKPGKKIESDEKYLYDCLNSITAEIKREKDDSEIILVMKCEKEKQEKIRGELNQRYGCFLQKYGSSLSCYFDDGNRSEARNLGATHAKSDILTFMDVDTVIGEGFLKMIKKDFAQGYGYVNNTTRPLQKEFAEKRRLRYYATFMGLIQWGLTLMGICRPYGYCMSVKKDICNKTLYDGEMFMSKLAGYGEDSHFGGRCGTHCRKYGIKGKYEKGKYIDGGKKKRATVYTSFRGWSVEGFWRGGARMMVDVFLVPLLNEPRPLIGNWRERKESAPYGND
jgi:glycosyltransferase involved in cell wall biosynthesis